MRIVCNLCIIFMIAVNTADSQVYTTFSGDTTIIWDKNIEWYCNALFNVNVNFSSDTIYIVELDTIPATDCICYYTVSTSFSDLRVGTYHAIVYRHFKDIHYMQFDTTIFAGSTSFTILTSPVNDRSITYKSSGCYEFPVSVHEDSSPTLKSAVLSNYPNPFNPYTVIRYSVPRKGFVSLTIFSLLGQQIATLVNEVKNPGTYEVNFYATDLATGIYFCRLITDNQILSNKIIVLK